MANRGNALSKLMGLTGGLLAMAAPALAAEADWPAFGHDPSNRNFSELTQIDRGNVGRLRPAWMFQTGVTGYFQAQPVMVDGVLYLSTTQNNVAALDARSGKVKWTYLHKARTDKIFGPPSNRGVAVANGLVYEATMDGRLIALDAGTGKVVWDKEAVRPEEGETETASGLADKLGGKPVQGSSRLGFKMPPLVAEGLVIVGVTGAGYGLHVEDPRAGSMAGRSWASRGVTAGGAGWRPTTREPARNAGAGTSPHRGLGGPLRRGDRRRGAAAP